MGIRTAVISLLLCLTASGTLLAQPNNNGVPMITNYPHNITGGSEQNWCVTQDARGVIYIGNNDKGVLEYDGVEWRSIPIPNDPIIRSLETGDDGVVYVGGESEFGYLAPDHIGNMHYRSLSDTIDQEKYPFTAVWRTYYHNGEVYFCTFSKIFIFNREMDQLSILETPEYTYFSYIIDGTLYVSDFGNGLMKFENDAFKTVKGGDFFKEMVITGLVKYDDNRLLAGTAEQGVYLFDMKRGTVDHSFLDHGLQDHFRNGVITYIRPLNDDFVVSSLYNGLVILKRNGKASEILSKSEGLIDEDITYVYSNDQLKGSGPLWITNWMGVSKLETHNPFRQFTEASGLEGFISDIVVFNKKLFVATFSGLYYKNSSSTSTDFISLPETRDQTIWHLHLFKPSPNVELLLASSEYMTFVVDKQLNVSSLVDLVINPHEGLQEREEYVGRHLVQDPKRPDIIYTGRIQIVGLQYTRGRWKEIMRVEDLPNAVIQKMGIDKYGYLWTSTTSRVIRIDISRINDATMKFFSEEDGLPAVEKNQVFIDPDSEEILLGTANGFYRYNYFRDTIYRDTIHNSVLPPGRNFIMTFIKDREGYYWYSFENEYSGWGELVARKKENRLEVVRAEPFQRLQNLSTDVIFSDPEGGVWFGKSNELYHFDKSFTRNDTLPFRTLIRSVSINSDSLLFNGTNFIEDGLGKYTIQLTQAEAARPMIRHRYNNIEFKWAAPFFEQEKELRYSYMLEGFDKEWSEWDGAAYKDFTNLPFGDYTIHVKAINVYGDESLPAFYTFTILRPWYASIPAIITYILLSGLLVYIIIKLYTRRLKQENLRLEGIIEERTAEIRKQKEELTDSIEYASRIQRALLPPDRLMDDHNMEHFILFRPRDIVSGDFYWMGLKNEKLIIVASDCTGHGVPGAFMSMLGMTFLDEIVIKAEITSTDQILEHLREHVITSLKQSGKSIEESTKDGMDLAMVSIDINTHEFQFSGAYNPLYLVRKLKRNEKTKLNKGEELELPRGSIHDDKNLLLQIRADQMPIGISEKTLPFTATSFKDEGYSIYLFSDGFLDQFGGPQGKKFMSKNFKKLILELQSVPMKEQGASLEKVLLGWMGEISQIDDILVMGLRMGEH
ncbi:MAG: triple tyrosine motif-containing protein [Bacteroidota bacterium]